MGINFDGDDIDSVIIEQGLVAVNSTKVPQFNESVIINLTQLNFTVKPAVFFNKEFLNESFSIIINGTVCEENTLPSCTNITYNATKGILSFNASSFSSFAAGNNPPTIFVITPEGIQNGTIPINFVVSDNENDPVSISAEFSTDGGVTFDPATGNSLADISTIQATEKIKVTNDALIDSDVPNTNFGNSTMLEAGTDGSRIVRSLVNVPLPNIDVAIIKSVTLNLFQRVSAGEPRTIGIYQIDGPFSQDNVTFNNAPENLSLVDSVFVDSTLEFFSWNITQYVINVTKGDIPNFGLMLRDITESTGTGLHQFASSEFSSAESFIEISFKGAQNTFFWKSRQDMNANNSDTVVIRLTINNTIFQAFIIRDNTQNFTVHNNHPPEVNESVNRTFIILEDHQLILNMSDFFFDIDNETLLFEVDDIPNISVEIQTDVNTSIVSVNNATGFQGEPDIAIGVNNSRFVVWNDRRNGNDSDIFLAEFDKRDAKIEEIQITDEDAEQSQPVIVTRGSDKYIVWRDDRLGNFDIFLAKVNASNDIAFEVNITTAKKDQGRPDLLISNKTLFVVWEDERNGNKDIFFAQYDLNGTRLTNDTSLFNVSLPEFFNVSDTKPVIAKVASDKYVAWVNNFSQIIAVKILANDTITNVFNISNKSSFADDPAISVDNRGLLYYVWSDSKGVTNRTRVFLAEFNDTANQGEFLIVNDSLRRFNPDIVVDRENTKFVTYQSEVNAQSDIRLARINITNGLVKEFEVIGNPDTQSNPTIAIDKRGSKVIAWQNGEGEDNIEMKSFSGPTGLIIFTPDLDFFGNRTFNITAIDRFNETSANFTIIILPVNDAPRLNLSLVPIVFPEDTNKTINLNVFFTEVEGENMTYNISVFPLNITVLFFNGSNATSVTLVLNATTENLTFVPDLNFFGLNDITLIVSDSLNASINNITINVTPVNDVPLITSLFINSTFGNNSKFENLTAFIDVFDPDNQRLKNIFDWRIKSKSIAVIHMPFEENTSNATFTKDFSSFKNNGTVVNATFNATGGFDGFGAYEFNGSHYIEIPYDDSFNITGDLTIEVRVKPKNTTGQPRIFSTLNKTGVQGYELRWNNMTAKYEFTVGHGASNTTVTAGTVNFDNFSHIVARANGTNISIFIDGVLINSTDQEGAIAGLGGSGVARIGLAANKMTGFFNGTIDEVRVYDRALSIRQIVLLAENITNIIVSDELEIRKRWSVVATPLDGIVEGDAVKSNTIRISTPSIIKQSFLDTVFFDGIF